jgi:uncharacterized protein
MCDQITLNKALNEFVDGVKDILGDKLREVILYGSYARGDYDKYSDIDVMILADIDRQTIHEYRSRLVELSCELERKYDYDILYISPRIQNYDFFQHWLKALLFYQNVRREGIVLSAR